MKKLLSYLTHKYGVRLVAMIVFLWLAGESIRVYYVGGEMMQRFLDIADYLGGPWLIAFLVAAFGDPIKNLTTGFYEKMRTLRIEAEQKK